MRFTYVQLQKQEYFGKVSSRGRSEGLTENYRLDIIKEGQPGMSLSKAVSDEGWKVHK
jgi:hypothetical protein